MTKIFISYRRIDTASITERICRLLRKQFGPGAVDIDVDSIPAGKDFRQAIREYIKRADVLLAIIGRQWLEARDYRGIHSVMDPNDWVRIEIGIALGLEVPVIPILIDGATMPSSGDLPKELQRLIHLQAAEMHGDAGFRRDMGRLATAIRDCLRSPPPPSVNKARPLSVRHEKSLVDLINAPRDYTVVMGSRRSWPVRLPCDILSSGDWADVVLVERLPGSERRYLVPDTLFTMDWTEDVRERDVFRSILLAVGAPDVNFASLLLNDRAIFRFLLDRKAHEDLYDVFDRVHNLDRSAQVEFFLRHKDELRTLVDRLCPGDVLDPVERGFGAGTGIGKGHSVGLVSLADHPFVPDEQAIFAGGVTGPATARAVSLLAGRRIFDREQNCFAGLESRPLGGVFRCKAPMRAPPHDVLHIEDDLEWVTRPYSKADLLQRLGDMLDSPHRPDGLTREDVDRMIALVERFDRALQPLPRQTGSRFHVIIPVGGRGTRMATQTRGRVTKVELPIALKRRRAGMPAEETVIGMLIRALAETRMVEDVLLLSSSDYLSSHRRMAEELARRYKIPIRVECDGSDGYAVALTKRLASHSHKGPSVLMMGDTLFHPKDLRALLDAAARSKALVMLGYSQVAACDVSRYGMVEIDKQGRVRQILEKPGKAAVRSAFQGVLVFYPYLRWDRLLADSGGSSLTALLSGVIARGIPVQAVRLSGPVYDCGNPDGYERACKAGQAGNLW